MQCSFRLDRDRNSGNVKMKTINNYKNTCRKEPHLDNIVNQLSIRLQDIKDQESSSTVGMPTCSIEQAEAVRRYYAAFPALKKGEESPLLYYLPPPAWCRKQTLEHDKKMQADISPPKDWNIKMKKYPSGKERRNSYHGQRKNKKRCNSFSRSLESKENLPEWMTHEGVWDMESQDPVREFIRAIALDEGYGTCENTLTDEVRPPLLHAPPAPRCWDDGLDLAAEWPLDARLTPREPSPLEEELYAKFEAKFDHSIEALWARDQNTPDDEYQDLPIDFAELLSSPSDRMFVAPPLVAPPPPPALPPPPDRFASLSSLASLPSLGSLGDSVWGCEVVAPPSPPLHDRLRPLHLASPPPPELESFALYEGEELYDALSTVASTVRSFTAINHSRDTSGFAEVPPRRHAAVPPAPVAERSPRRAASRAPEDLLTSARTHFRPIRREWDAEAPRYADGDTFDIRGSLEPVEFNRSASGGAYLGAGERYLEYRPEARRAGGGALPLRFPVRQRDAGVQTDTWVGLGAEEYACAAKKARGEGCGSAPSPEEVSRDWEELVAEMSAAQAQLVSGGVRKRRHSAALRCARRCALPHARFLPCAPHHRPLTR